VRNLGDGAGRYAGLALGAVERVGLDAADVLGVSGRRALDELRIGEAGVDDLARDRVGERYVAADVETEPEVRELGRARAPRVYRDQPRAVADSAQQVVEEDRMRFARVGAPKDDEVGLLNLLVRRGSSPGSECCRQTDD